MMGAPTRHRGRSRYPTRSRNAGATGAAPATFNPLTDWTTDPLHGVWASDPLWTPPADGGAVSSWRNGGSVAGVDLTQATGSKQPTYDAANPTFNNAATVNFVTDDVLLADIATLDDPFWTLVIGNTNTNATGFYTWVAFGGGARLILWPAIGGIYAQGDSGTALSRAMADTAAHFMLLELSGATSNLRIDNSTSPDVAVGDTAATYLSLGAGNTGGGSLANYLNGSIALALVFNTDPTALPEWATFTSWVKTTYGLTIA